LELTRGFAVKLKAEANIQAKQKSFTKSAQTALYVDVGFHESYQKPEFLGRYHHELPNVS
jgi:hypothetical protein